MERTKTEWLRKQHARIEHKRAVRTATILHGLRRRKLKYGMVTMCIGTGPLGVLMIGALSERVGPAAAILMMAGTGVAGLSLVWRRLISASSSGTASKYQ